jgi:hypothetical protein
MGVARLSGEMYTRPTIRTRETTSSSASCGHGGDYLSDVSLARNRIHTRRLLQTTELRFINAWV